MDRPYSLILLDACMPGTSGPSVAAMVRDRAELSSTRIILLTSAERPGDLAQARMLRIEARVLRPTPQNGLLDTIYRTMRRGEGDASPNRSTGEIAASALPNLRILVAEDNEFNARHLERLLGRRGHCVRIAADGRHALELLGVDVERGQDGTAASGENKGWLRDARPAPPIGNDDGIRPVAPGPTHARTRWFPGRQGDPRMGADRSGALAGHRPDGAFPEGGSRALPGVGNG
jgi:CheY-like chemotaxis protein